LRASAGRTRSAERYRQSRNEHAITQTRLHVRGNDTGIRDVMRNIVERGCADARAACQGAIFDCRNVIVRSPSNRRPDGSEHDT
jgi:hypothetical protein